MISPETDASSFTKAEKSIAVMPRAPHRRHHPTYRRSASPATAAAACRPASVVPRSRAGPCSAGAKAGFMSISGASRAAGSGVAVPLVATLISIYIVSQFLRNSIGVIAPNLAAELVLSPAEIGLLSSAFFLVFAGLQVGIGTLGTLMATAPLAMSTAAIGWRASFLAVGAFTLVVAVLIAAVVRDDARPRSRHESWGESLSGIVAVMRTPSM